MLSVTQTGVSGRSGSEEIKSTYLAEVLHASQLSEVDDVILNCLIDTQANQMVI